VQLQKNLAVVKI